MVEHRGLSNLVGWHNRAYQVSEEDRGAWLAAVSFDASVWELWPYLACGASVAVGGAEEKRELGALPGWLREQGVSICFLATPLVEALLSEEGVEWSVRALLTGADRLTMAPRAGSGLRLFNNYGPTEYTVVATAGEVRAGAEGRPPAIGRPIANTRAYVLGRGGEELPVGVAGELYLGGAGLARGYLGQPELTAERFVETARGRLYRTGDQVRWTQEGELEYVGRGDEQVKIRGYRVELGEVEAALRGSGLVREAAVVAQEEAGGLGRGRRRLVAYVVGCGQEAELREALGRRLPEYMVPSAYVALEALPLTTSGKLDRRQLPEPPSARTEYEPPGTPVEEILADVWREVLRVERVGIHDNFFDLGGDSIASMRVMSRVRQAFEVPMPVGVIFAAPTVAQLAERVESSAIDQILATRGSE
jgi:acyl-coenzyme A synthetase/AMP-(fatty) acid ligase/acyl carrier protein